MTVLDLYLVRHGHSWGQVSVDGRGMMHVPMDKRPPGCETGRMEDDWYLTPLGCQQVDLLGKHLSQTSFDMIFCSPLMALLGLPAPEHLFRFGQDNTGLSRIIFSSEDVPASKRVRLYCLNDLSHLTPELHRETVGGNIKTLYGNP